MRAHCYLALLVACSSTKPAPTPTTGGTAPVIRVEPDPTTVQTAQLQIANLVAPAATAVTRTPYEHFPVAGYVHDLIGAGAPCWRELERGVLATYQIQTPEPSSYFVIEGSLPQATAWRCVPESFKGNVEVKVKKDGELVVFDLGELGSVYAAWRGRYIVVGERRQVEAALRTPTDASNPWLARLAPTSAAPIWQYRTDRLMESLFGATSLAYLVELDRLVTKPAPQFAGRAIIWYRSGSDAAVVGRRVKAGELSVQGSPGLVDTFRQMKVEQEGAKVTLSFDHHTFALVDIDEVLQLASKWAAGN